jgi:hypothetical protein
MNCSLRLCGLCVLRVKNAPTPIHQTAFLGANHAFRFDFVRLLI